MRHRLLLGAPHGVVEGRGLLQGAGPVELGVAPDRRDGRAQLVGRVGHELAEPALGRRALVEGLLDAPEHPVERHAEVARLRARRRPPAPDGERSPAAMAPAVSVIRCTGRTPRRMTQPVTTASTASTASDGGDLHHDQAAHRVVDVVEREAQHRRRPRGPSRRAWIR